MGANGILTEHILTPQKATGVPDGDDAPIELCHKPELEWNLLRYNTSEIHLYILLFYFRQPHWAKLSASYGEDGRLVAAYKSLKEHRESKVF